MPIPARLATDGFAIVPGVLDDAEVEALLAAVAGASSESSALRRGESLYGFRDILRRIPEVRRLAASPAIRRLVEPHLGPRAFAVRGLFFDKTPAANWTLPWHRDLTIALRLRLDVPGFGPWTTKAGVPHAVAPQGLLNRMLTVRVHLDDTGPDNAPLKVVPGSHLDEGDEPPRLDPVACLVPRGGALLMRPRLLHASSPAEAPGHRRVIHLEFAAEGLPGGLQWFETVGEP